ncbi:BAG family molecular chaperone regulator 1-like [Canna indica]|uniref:BAG family molecular chaperone regulator 1-like n=1 Tax=Canna indica TaxID=4628 RepID=A0AAQ3QJ37_9LILI|nr:BAG family molecular chaperone regulator 1-like [Canna indica]
MVRIEAKQSIIYVLAVVVAVVVIVGRIKMPASADFEAAEWAVTPGGMVVQKRDSALPAAVVPTIRVKVKYGAVYHDIYISSRASFGELKKMLSERIGVHPSDQKLIYKEKERDSAAFLDAAGVKDRSKVVVEEDATAKAKRLLEMRVSEKRDKAAKRVSAISLEVDKLASKATAMEAVVSKGGRVVEEDVVGLIELLMNEVVKLEGVDVVDGDVKLQKRLQVRRVQKYVETLDLIKIKNAVPKASHGRVSQQQPPQPRFLKHQQQRQPLESVILTANWKTSDSLMLMSSASAPAPAAAAPNTAPSSATTRFDWELF